MRARFSIGYTPVPDSGALAGVRVLVTRPAHQSETLSALIEAAGGVALRHPTIEIVAPTDAAALAAVLARLDDFDLAVFVSPNAVTHGLAALRAQRDAWPAALAVACVGPGSARALAEAGLTQALVPARYDSEGLLALEPLRAPAGRRVLILRGEGGRELLAETLRRRGAHVEYAECYRRVAPRGGAPALARAFLQGRVDAISVTSADALRNLYEMLAGPARPRLVRTPIAVVSERLRDLAQELGHDARLAVAHAATDEAMVAAIATIAGACSERQKNL